MVLESFVDVLRVAGLVAGALTLYVVVTGAVVAWLGSGFARLQPHRPLPSARGENEPVPQQVGVAS